MSAKPVSFLSVHHGHSHSQSGREESGGKEGGRGRREGSRGQLSKAVRHFLPAQLYGAYSVTHFLTKYGIYLFSSDGNVEQLHVEY